MVTTNQKPKIDTWKLKRKHFTKEKHQTTSISLKKSIKPQGKKEQQEEKNRELQKQARQHDKK